MYGIPEIDLISGEVEDTDEDDEEAGGLEEDKGNENPIVKGVKTIGDAFVTAIRSVIYRSIYRSINLFIYLSFGLGFQTG